jgi:hypothetical protein
VFGDDVVAAAMIDRLIHHAEVIDHQRNAKLQLTVLLSPAGPVPGLYLHPDHRRRLRRPAVRSDLSV